ncbi:MAG: hypothetical protein COS85_15920 [Armatimonadetes bacterium CG07_land_8_20_14_0_80_59_28]|nr:MAG: hypothetical protein COS85_15920 [Armatimonadetes bacterium CG07_land_8_20_14_0_80_59_28]
MNDGKPNFRDFRLLELPLKMPRPIALTENPGEYYDEYPCAARLGNGDLLVVFTRATMTTKPMQAMIVGIRSCDDGRTWSEPFTLISTPDMLDFDPNTIAWDNTVMVISTTCPILHAYGQVTTSRFLAVRSEDNARTWSEPVEISHAPYVYCSGKINPGVRFPDGTLAFAFTADEHLQSGREVTGDSESWGASGVMISTDDGLTWAPGETVGIQQERPEGLSAINGLDEPALAVCRDGSLYALLRSGFEQLYEACSPDQGRTWGEPKPSGLTAHNCPADLCVFNHPRLGRGWLVVYDHSPKNRYPLAVAISMDEGVSWSQPKIIADEGVPTCYPACVQASSGDIFLVWQQDRAGSDARTWRELRGCLLELDEVEEIGDELPVGAS